MSHGDSVIITYPRLILLNSARFDFSSSPPLRLRTNLIHSRLFSPPHRVFIYRCFCSLEKVSDSFLFLMSVLPIIRWFFASSLVPIFWKIRWDFLTEVSVLMLMNFSLICFVACFSVEYDVALISFLVFWFNTICFVASFGYLVEQMLSLLCRLVS